MRTVSSVVSGLLLSLVSLALAGGLSGCRNRELTRALGRYDGFVIEKASGRSRTHRATAEVRLDEEAPRGPRVEVLVALEGGPQAWEFELSSRVKGRVTLQVKGEGLPASTLSLRPVRDTCYIPRGTPRGVQPLARLCFERREWILDLVAADGKTLSFVFDRIDESVMPMLETPRDYTPEELLSRAMDQGFDSRLEFEKVIQARMNAQIAHWNLLPHFALGTVLGFIQFNGWTLVRSVGELVPFLLPTRWLRAREASLEFEAERAAYILLRANAASIAEGLAITALRDRASLEAMRSERAELEALRGLLSLRERMGLLPPGATDQIDSLLVATDEAILLLENVRKNELASVSQAAGFINPGAVADIVDSGEIAETETAGLPGPADWRELAMVRSYELRQIDALIDQVRVDRIARTMNWIDPAGDSGSSIGLGFGAYLQVGASQLREALVRREQQQMLLLQSADAIARDLETAERSLGLAERSLRLQQARIDRHSANLRLGFSIPVDELAQACQARMQARVRAIEARHSRRLLSRKSMRLLYLGPYLEAQNVETRPPR